VGRVAVTHASQLDDVLGVVTLTESDAAVVLMDLYAEVEAEKTEVAHLKVDLHLSTEGLHLRFFCAGDDEVIDIDTNLQNRVSLASLVHRRLKRALLEAHLLECAVQLGVPRSRCLPQPIQVLPYSKHLALLPGNVEARTLPDIHLFLQVTIEERRLDVHVVDAPPHHGSEREKDVDGIDVSHRREHVINPFLLDKPRAMSLTLCLTTSPTSFFLSLNTHFRVIGRWPTGKSTISHRGAPGRITLNFSEGAKFPGVRQVELDIDVVLHAPWHHRLVAEDVIDGAVAQ
jgi:hypothetical protein